MTWDWIGQDCLLYANGLLTSDWLGWKSKKNHSIEKIIVLIINFNIHLINKQVEGYLLTCYLNFNVPSDCVHILFNEARKIRVYNAK